MSSLSLINLISLFEGRKVNRKGSGALGVKEGSEAEGRLFSHLVMSEGNRDDPPRIAGSREPE